MQRHHVTASIILVLAATACVIAGREFMEMHRPDVLHPSRFVTKSGALSDYFPALRGTNGDTPVYIFDSGTPGATVLVLGGTHPNEPAGFMTAVLLVENANPVQGRLIVIPQACRSGFSCTDPLEGYPQQYSLESPTGIRTFRFGARAANVLDQWPDPLVYLHYPSGQQLSGNETRNLNRSYPGRPDGSFTQKICFGIMELLKKENVTVAFDLHEAAPEIPIINAIVAHEKNSDMAASAVLNLELDGLQYALEISPRSFHGLSHREWGDGTAALPFLMETSNPIQGRLRGRTTEGLIVQGKDDRYREAAQLGTFRITYDLDGESLARRVGRHMQAFKAILASYNEQHAENPIVLENLPNSSDLLTHGVGYYLH
jgi:hypothetical protein